MGVVKLCGRQSGINSYVIVTSYSFSTMTTKVRLAILSSHPIQYYAPVFRALAQCANVEPRVFYTWSQTADEQISDPGFSIALRWDIPLLEGYGYEFVPNVASDPGTQTTATDVHRIKAAKEHQWPRRLQ